MTSISLWPWRLCFLVILYLVFFFRTSSRHIWHTGSCSRGTTKPFLTGLCRSSFILWGHLTDQLRHQVNSPQFWTDDVTCGELKWITLQLSCSLRPTSLTSSHPYSQTFTQYSSSVIINLLAQSLFSSGHPNNPPWILKRPLLHSSIERMLF